MLEYVFHEKVRKFLAKRDREFLVGLNDKLSVLCRDPMAKTLDVKRLRGLKYCFRLRIGKYRLLYEIRTDEGIIIFFKAGSRGDVYK